MYHLSTKKVLWWEVAEECHFTFKQTQLSQTISMKIQLPFFWDQHSAVPLPVLSVLEILKFLGT